MGGLWHDSLEQYFRQYLFEVEHIVVRMGRFATFVKVGEKSLCFVNLKFGCHLSTLFKGHFERIIF